MLLKPFKLGVIGGGLNSSIGLTHRVASEMDKRWEIQSGCFSRQKDINLETGVKWAVRKDRVYDGWEELLVSETEHLDAIVVLTPIPSHAEIVIKAIEAGYNIICEKSLASSSEEAKKIKEVVKKNNVFLAVIYNYAGYPMLRELKMMIQDGMLGEINQIHIEMPQETFARLDEEQNIPNLQAWRLNHVGLSSVSLDLGAHVHHIINFLSDKKPIELFAVQDSFGFFDQVMDNTMCIAKYTGDLTCRIWYSKSALGHRNGLKVCVYGTEGSAEWYQMNPETLFYNDNRGNKSIIDRSTTTVTLASQPRYNRFKVGHPIGFIEAFANHYYDIADSLTEFYKKGYYSSPWVFGLDVAIEGLSMLEAIESSAKNKEFAKI